MDRRVQELDHGPHDDTRGLSQRHSGLSRQAQEHARRQRLYRRLVISILFCAGIVASLVSLLSALMLDNAAQTQGRNIRHYSNYLTERARAFRETGYDWVRENGHGNRLETLSVNKGLLRETEVVQHQLTALLKCDVGALSLSLSLSRSRLRARIHQLIVRFVMDR